MGNRYVIASAADEPYFPGLLVSLGSALACGSPGSRYRVIVLDGGLSKESSSILANTCRFIAGIRNIDLTLDTFELNQETFKLLPAKRGSKMFYGRLLLPSLLNEESEVIYLDADILCYKGIENLNPARMDALIAGAIDPGIPTLHDDCPWANQLQPDEYGLPYLNSGVLWMNLTAFRDEQLVEQAIALRSQSTSQRLADQSVLNFVCRGRAAPADVSFNLLVSDKTNGHLTRPANFHFFGGKKPWQPRPDTGAITATILFRQAFDALVAPRELSLDGLMNPPGRAALRLSMMKNIFNLPRSYRYFRALRQLTAAKDVIHERAREWRDKLSNHSLE